VPNANSSETKTASISLFNKAFKILIVSVLTALAITLLLTVLGISLLLGSQSTREWLVQDIATEVLSSSSLQLDIQDFNSPHFGFWYFESVSINISDQQLFSADKLLINFDAKALLDKKIDVLELSADHLTIVIPDENNTDKALIDKNSDKSSDTTWRAMLVPVRLQKLALRDVEILGTKFNNPTFQIDGSSEFLWQDKLFTSKLTLKTETQPEAQINLQAVIDKNFSGTLTATVKEAPGGWIGQTISLPKEQAVDFNLELTALRDKASINWVLQSFKMPWQQHKIIAIAQGQWGMSNERLDISQFALSVDNKQQILSGWWHDQLFELNIALNEFPIELSDAFQDYIVGGQITGSAKIAGNLSNPSFQANLQANTHYKNQAVMLDIKGEGDAQIFNIEKAFVNLGDAKASANGSILIEKQKFDLQIQKLSGPVRIIETFDVEFPDDLYIELNEVHGFLKGTFTSPVYSGFTKAKGRYKEQVFDFQSEFNGDIEKVDLSGFSANISAATIKAVGLIDWQNEKFDLSLDSNKLPLSLMSLLNVDLPSDLSARVNTTGRLTGEFTLPYFKGNIGSKGYFKNLPFISSVNLDGDLKTLHFSELTANLGDAQLQAWGDIQLNQQILNINIKELTGPSKFAQNFDIIVPADLVFDLKIMDGHVFGAFNNPSYSGMVSANGYFKNQTLDIQSKVKGDIEKIELNDLIANYSKGNLQASGLIDWSHESLDLKLHAINVPAYLASIAGIKLPDDFSAQINTNGELKGDFSFPLFKGDASAVGDYQDTHFDIMTSLDSSSDQIDITKISATLMVKHSNKETPESSIQGSGIYSISRKQLDGKLKVLALPYHTIRLAGIEPPKNLSGSLNADLSISGKLPLPIIYGSINGVGELEGEPFSFEVVGSQKDQNLFFDHTQLFWHDTILSANGLVSKDKLDLHIKLQELNLTDLNTFGFDLKPGNLDLYFDLLGSMESPKLDGLVKLTVNKQNNPGDVNAPLEDIMVTTKFMTENDILVIDSEVRHGLEAKAKLQINSTFKPFLNWLADDSSSIPINDLPLNVKAKGDIGLNWINDFIDRDIQNISGNLTLDTQLTGSLNSPRINGSLGLLDGMYINALSQTKIQNAQIQLAFDEKSITIIKAKANDGDKGTLNLDGSLVLADGDNGLIDITLNLSKASLVRREDIEGDATGSIQLIGDLKQILVTGDINVAPFQIMLDLIPTDSIPEIQVSLKEDSSKTQKNKLDFPPIALKINIDVEQQAYIRGRGLDAELKGKLTLSGTSIKPNYNGQFSVVRGTFELFAKTFKLEEGDVLFSNDAVSLFVQGRHKGKDFTFIASLSGTLDDLKIELRTEPSLPEDEALARLLFGKSVRNITPIQAIQLASAIQTLRGEGGGFDPLGKARELFRVDKISIESQETSEGNGVAVGVGKYITEGVYVELARTPDPSQPWKGSVEVELTPNINLETTSGGSSGFGGVELQWKHDY
jgi:translocation and assembly module TamB